MEFNEREPIYLQIIDDFKQKFANGTYQPGQEIPSRRDLAAQLRVNPNTVQRAYREMEEMNLIKTLRGQGSFLTDDASVARTIREEMVNRLVSDFVRKMSALGRSAADILSDLKLYLDSKGSDPVDHD
ncbi:GntR family transcriptional regulator [Effusibacillus dendaii]|uniref:GntR family transcriptional regulator n=1 Tax=Effusibacillus dendaii TaxID=2743772 RepID=A0A7I8DBV1_9BACL|nr:GntR family transcriptional regulator [Effusibacillus dendaii]BCJ87574.1 GntR family transcriptional regulator [Effusibacillus dendaii]